MCTHRLLVSALISNAVDRVFEPRSGQIKVNKIGICCLFAKHTPLSSNSKDILARNQNNVTEWIDISTR